MAVPLVFRGFYDTKISSNVTWERKLKILERNFQRAAGTTALKVASFILPCENDMHVHRCELGREGEREGGTRKSIKWSV